MRGRSPASVVGRGLLNRHARLRPSSLRYLRQVIVRSKLDASRDGMNLRPPRSQCPSPGRSRLMVRPQPIRYRSRRDRSLDTHAIRPASDFDSLRATPARPSRLLSSKYAAVTRRIRSNSDSRAMAGARSDSFGVRDWSIATLSTRSAFYLSRGRDTAEPLSHGACAYNTTVVRTTST